MSYNIYVKNGTEKEYSFYSVVPSFTVAVLIEKELKGIGCEHILCTGNKEVA